MERATPEPKGGTPSVEVKKRSTSLTPVSTQIRPRSPSQSFTSQPIKQSQRKSESKATSTGKETSGRKSRHTDIGHFDDLAPIVAPKLAAHKKKPVVAENAQDSASKSKPKGIQRRGLPKLQEVDDIPQKSVVNTSPLLKQWDFRLKKQAPESARLDINNCPSDDEEAKSLRPPQGPPPMMKFNRQSFSLLAAPVPAPSLKIFNSPALTKLRVPKNGKVSQIPHQVSIAPDFVLSGHQRTGAIDDMTAPSMSHTLAILEASVSRARRLREELLQAQRQVLLGFRSVVKVYFSSTQSSLPSLRGAGRAGSQAPIPLIKCSVVVHTLVTTIQSYVRFRNSSLLVQWAAKGNDLQSVRSAIEGKSLPPAPLDSIALNEAAAMNSTMQPLDHAEVLDSTTIAQLKQLYFAYYDCESYVLDGNDDNSATSKRLGSAKDRDVRNVIEEANVLVPTQVVTDMQDAPHAADLSFLRESNADSMLFDEHREWKQIYSDDDDCEEP